MKLTVASAVVFFAQNCFVIVAGGAVSTKIHALLTDLQILR